MGMSLSFEESLSGSLAQNISAYRLHELSRRNFHSKGSKDSKKIFLNLTVRLLESELKADPFDIKGKVQGQILIADENFEILEGDFELMTASDGFAEADTFRQMRYRLKAESNEGKRISLLGNKRLKAGRILNIWNETTTLFTTVFDSFINFDQTDRAPSFYGLCTMSATQVAETLPTFRSDSKTIGRTLLGASQYLSGMSRGLTRIYNPLTSTANFQIESVDEDFQHLNAGVSVHDLMTRDGYHLKLTRFQSGKGNEKGKAKGSILLLHGLTTSTHMFTMKEHTSLVAYLLSEGYCDIWSLDWRGSGRFPYNLEGNDYTLDHIIAFDIPLAVETIRKTIGPKTKLHAISHCIGSMTMACSLASGKTKGISSFISNSVSLTPAVSPWSQIKLRLGPDLLEHVLKIPHLSPQSARKKGLSREKILAKAIAWVHPESSNPECNMVSFLWGSGYPAAYNLENLHPETYARLGTLFGGTSFKLYRHIELMTSSQSARPANLELRKELDLPEDYLDAAIQNGLPPTLLLSGEINRIFPGSNQLTYKKLQWARSDLDVRYIEIPNYGHQDVFMGRAARVDVFPKIVEFLKSLDN